MLLTSFSYFYMELYCGLTLGLALFLTMMSYCICLSLSSQRSWIHPIYLYHICYFIFLFLFPFKHFEMLWEYLLPMLEYRLFWQFFNFDVHFLQVEVISRLLRRSILLLEFLQHLLVCSHISPINFQRVSRLIARLSWIKR